MFKFLLGTLISFGFINVFSAENMSLRRATLQSIDAFSLAPMSIKFSKMQTQINLLKPIQKFALNTAHITRYQHFHHGIPVVGSQVFIANNRNHEVNGFLVNELNIDTVAQINRDQALKLARRALLNLKPTAIFEKEKVQLQIREDKSHQWRLVYLVTFVDTQVQAKNFSWPHLVVDAQTGEILQSWDSAYNYQDVGVGGNERIKKYWYGLDGVPGLEVFQQGETCVMETSNAKLVDLNFNYDFEDELMDVFKYPCQKMPDDAINGGYSPRNDAWYYTLAVSDMFNNWFNIPVLSDAYGKAIQLVVRIHFGQSFANAFWNGETVSLGDGDQWNFYPLTSPDVIAHEFTHGFTSSHADLEYHDESGALNESFSDMAGITFQYYLLKQTPLFYQLSHILPDKISWKIGDTIINPTGFFDEALRFLDLPSNDNLSADCYDKKIARKNKGLCAIDYNELVTFLKTTEIDENMYQSMIVHYASGIFNHLFYYLAEGFGVQPAFALMVHAHVNYWRPTTDFQTAACDLLQAADDLKMNGDDVKKYLLKIGIDGANCKQ